MCFSSMIASSKYLNLKMHNLIQTISMNEDVMLYL